MEIYLFNYVCNYENCVLFYSMIFFMVSHSFLNLISFKKNVCKNIKFLYFYVYWYFACVSIYVQCLPDVHRAQKRV